MTVAATAAIKAGLEAGKDYRWGACRQSENRSFCDGTGKTLA